MVQKSFFAKSGICFFILAGIGWTLSACGAAVATRDLTTGPFPVVLEAKPSSASPGDTVELVGAGFSLVAQENIVTTGGASTVASTYEVASDHEKITFKVPSQATPGSSSLLVIVDGDVSNSVTFTVKP